MRTIAIIPARYDSSRFPGKPLAKIQGKAMIEWVYKGVEKSRLIEKIIVATDDKRIFDYCLANNMCAEMTSQKHISGTDRIAELVEKLNCENIINVQGDEPLINSEIIDVLIERLHREKNLKISTLARELEVSEFGNRNVVKVQIEKNFAKDFFRNEPNDKEKIFAHIGIYGYKRDFLLQFSALKPSDREEEEKLEQLRVIDNGVDLGVDIVGYNGIGVDAPEDIKKVESIMERLYGKR